MNVKIYMPKFATDMDIEWTDREKVFLAFMLEVSYVEGWETTYYMHITDFCRIIGSHPAKLVNSLTNLRQVFRIAHLSNFTIRIQGRNPGKYHDGTLVKSQLQQLTDYKAIAMWYYLAGHMVKGFDHMLSDHEEGKEIVYTHRDQFSNEQSRRLNSQLEVFNDIPEKDLNQTTSE